MTGSAAAPHPHATDIAPRVAVLFRELALLLEDVERERDRFYADVARIPPYSPNLPQTVTALRLGDRCIAMRRVLVGLEGDARPPAHRHITMNRPPTSGLHWTVINAARAQMARDPDDRQLVPPPAWDARVQELRGLIAQAREASLTGTAWPSPP